MDIKRKVFRFGAWQRWAAWFVLGGSALVFSAGCLPGNGVLGAHAPNATADFQTTVNVTSSPAPNATADFQTTANVTSSLAQNLTSVIVADNTTRKPVCPNQKNINLPPTHIALNCTDCHADLAIIAELKASPQDCSACHQKDDKHNGADGAKCGECHGATSWKGLTVDHNKTSYPLTGKHTGVDCSSCHANGVYKGTPNTCLGCHASDDTHKGAFGPNCGDCHTTAAWKPATYNKPHTAFPLNHGASRGTTTSCSTCHPTSLPSLLQYTCYGCHQHTVANILSRHRNTQNLDDCMKCHANGRRGG